MVSGHIPVAEEQGLNWNIKINMKRNEGRPGFILVCRCGWESNPVIYKLGGGRHDVNALEGSWATWASSLGLCPQCTLILGSSFPFLASSIPKPKLAPIPSAILSLGHKNPEWGGYPLNVALQPHTPSLTLNFLPVSLTPMAKLKTQLFPHLLPGSTWISCLPVLLFFSQTLKQLSSSFFLSPFKKDFINENPTETSFFSVANQYQIPRSFTS